MTSVQLNNPRTLGALFMLGQACTIIGVIIGFGGLMWNFMATIFGLILCSSGLALAKFSRERLSTTGDYIHPSVKVVAISDIFRYVRLVSKISIGFAGICMLLLIIGVPGWINAGYLIYALIASVLVSVITIFASSIFVAWHDFFRRCIKK